MDKLKMNHQGLHHEKGQEDDTQPLVSSLLEQDSRHQEADLDALEARLFAMARSRK